MLCLAGVPPWTSTVKWLQAEANVLPQLSTQSSASLSIPRCPNFESILPQSNVIPKSKSQILHRIQLVLFLCFLTFIHSYNTHATFCRCIPIVPDISLHKLTENVSRTYKYTSCRQWRDWYHCCPKSSDWRIDNGYLRLAIEFCHSKERWLQHRVY